jgi:acyl-CoA thioester hydrolase
MARHTYQCAMRWSDMDAQGHINNSAFLVYLEQARVSLLFEHAVDEGVPTIAEGVVIARHEIDYRRPVLYGPEPLAVQLWCSRIGGASFTLDYEVYDGADLAVEAKTVCVPYDLSAGRVRRLTDAERAFVERFSGSAG